MGSSTLRAWVCCGSDTEGALKNEEEFNNTVESQKTGRSNGKKKYPRNVVNLHTDEGEIE